MARSGLAEERSPAARPGPAQLERYAVEPDMPGLTGAAVERLYTEGAAWLAGAPLRARPATSRASSPKSPQRDAGDACHDSGAADDPSDR
jgi:hypothetical protein